MKQTLPAKLIAQFAKLQIVYQQATGGTGGSIPSWLTDVLNFLENYRHDSAITMNQLATNWHRESDSTVNGSFQDCMIKANEEYKNMNSTIDA